MPIYEFECGKCGKDSELLVRSSDWKGTACPHCGSTRLEKKLSVFASAGGGMSEAAPACGMPSPSGGCGACCGGGPHRH
jgi:putative FmdB family regulatory protein